MLIHGCRPAEIHTIHQNTQSIKEYMASQKRIKHVSLNHLISHM
jgi:hypothetical protein